MPKLRMTEREKQEKALYRAVARSRVDLDLPYDQDVADNFKKLVEKAANSEVGFWDIKAEAASGTRVTVRIHCPRKEGESYGGEAVSI